MMAATILLMAATLVHAQDASLQLINDEMLPPLSANCAQALTANITCAYLETGGPMYQQTPNYTVDSLDQMCTAECASSITDYRTGVLEACDNDIYNDTSNATQYGSAMSSAGGVYSPIVLPDYYFTNYKQRCVKDSAGNYCYPYLQTTDEQDACDECGLKVFQAQLENGYFYNKELASEYSSLTSSCGVATLPVTPPPSVVVASKTGAGPTPTCSGRVAEIPAGGTCDSVAAANNISTWQLLAANGLDGGCGNFPASGNLCITGSCQPYKVSSDDSCLTIANHFGIYITQLRTWNPNLNYDCSNLNTTVGHQICVSNPSNFTLPTNTRALTTTAPTVAAPVPTDVVAGTNVKCGSYYHVVEGDTCAHITIAKGISLNDFLFLNPEVNANCTNLYLNYSYCVQPVGNILTYSGYSDGSTSGSTGPTVLPVTGTPVAFDSLPDATIATLSIAPTATFLYPLANGTRKDCAEYSDNSFGDVDCGYLNEGVTVSDFVSWNPSLSPFTCTLRNETRYCTVLGDGYISANASDTAAFEPAPANAATDSTAQCYEWYTITSGDTCSSVEASFAITLAQFYTWNPSIQSDCTGLQLNVAYCVFGVDTTSGDGPPAPTQSGIVDNCTDYYVVKSGDGCQAIADAHNITVAKFEAWNPAVGSDCSTLQPDYAVCVAVAGQSSTTTSATSSPSSTASCATAPGPTQTGTYCQCNKFVQQKDNKYCGDLASDNGITLEQFYQLNPAVGDSCQYLVGGDWYCVGGPILSSGSTTTTTPTSTASPTCATAPGPTQTGMPCKCKKFVQQTSGKYCGDLASDNGISLEQFYAWNPAVGDSCQYLVGGDYYCVSA